MGSGKQGGVVVPPKLSLGVTTTGATNSVDIAWIFISVSERSERRHGVPVA